MSLQLCTLPLRLISKHPLLRSNAILLRTMSGTGRQKYEQTAIEDWTRSDLYHNRHLIEPDPALSHAYKNSLDNDLPDIAVSEAQGKFLYLLLKSVSARRVIEVGTLGGYSTIWLAKALPADGKIISLELEKKHALVARANIQNAGLSSKVEIVVGPAIEGLKALPAEPAFDVAFIDADKSGNQDYFVEAERLVRKGGIIIVDNVVRYGRTASEEITDDVSVNGVRRLLTYLKGNTNVECTTIGTVGEKGYDGFLYAVKK